MPITKGGRWQVSKATLLSTLVFLIIYFRTPAVLLHCPLCKFPDGPALGAAGEGREEQPPGDGGAEPSQLQG